MTDLVSASGSKRSRVTRRTVIAGASSALVAGGAGCMDSFGSSRGATDVFVANDTAMTQDISLGVHDVNGDYTPIQTTLTIPPNEHRNPTRQDKIPWGGNYRVTVAVADGVTETYKWTDIHEALYIFLRESELTFAIRETPPASRSADP